MVSSPTKESRGGKRITAATELALMRVQLRRQEHSGMKYSHMALLEEAVLAWEKSQESGSPTETDAHSPQAATGMSAEVAGALELVRDWANKIVSQVESELSRARQVDTCPREHGGRRSTR